MKFIFKIVHSRFIDGSDTQFSIKIVLLEKHVSVKVIKVISILNLFGTISNHHYDISFFLLLLFLKYLVDKVRAIGIAPILSHAAKLSIILVRFNPVKGLYLVL